MARIPGGAFVMGTHGGTGEYAYISRPAHRVELDSFCLDKREVTVEAYQRCVDAGTCTEPAEACVGGQPRPLDHPVNCVDWHQSRAYCLGRGKDLPTEAQWEYAGRGGAKQHDYPWGNGSGKGRACFMNVSITTCAVGTFPEEAFGLFDMAGNVSEWTFDWLSEGYPKTVPRNYQGPPAPPIPSSPKRTFRGGSFEGQFMQSASPKARGFALPGTFGLALGFRCAS